MKKLELEDFEFSQSYVFFWDKIERCNYFLNTVADVFRRETKEEPDGRLVSFLLHDPINDGGQWDMVVNIIEKHGLMPKKCFPESFSCESSRRMNQIIKSKMREFARDIHVAIVQDKADNDTVHQLIRSQMAIVYR
jgi:bleomycin hydrolase